MINRNRVYGSSLNKGKKKKKKSSKVTIYVEKNRPGSKAAKALRSFRGLDRIRKPR